MSEHHCCQHGGGHAPVAATKEWFCPMCPGAESDHPGSCPMCGMALERNPAFVRATVFTCPMHPEVRQDHPGDCPKCGMALEPLSPEAEPPSELQEMTRRFRVGLPLALPVFFLAMAEHVPAWRIVPPTLSAWIQFVLSTPVVLWCGLPFFQRAWHSLVTRHLNMFTLIGLGTGAAYAFSVIVLLFPAVLPHALRHGGMLPIYFEAAAVIIVLVLLGQVLELRAREGTGAALRALLDLTPTTAHRVRDGQTQEISLAQVEKGDLLRIKPGGKVPVDGPVVEGRSAVDESLITGESMPVEKQPGDRLVGGTLNGSGSLLMQAERVGSETLLAHIVQMVSQAQRSRAPIQRVADAVAGWFVPAVVLVALLTFGIWMLWGPAPAFTYALVNAVAVLIIACPCALGLATPMSIMVAVGRGAGAGILIRDAATLETLEKIDTLVMDKTGTLTLGRPTVTGVIAAGSDENNLLARAAALEEQSEHPLAGAVIRLAKERNLSLPTGEDFSAIPGGGVRGRVEGHSLVIGSHALLTRENVAGFEPFETRAQTAQDEGHTVMWIAADGAVEGFLELSDPVKETTPDAIRALRALGVRLIMLTGDNARTAVHLARRLGLDEFVAEASPADKHERVRNLQTQGRSVAMAGDGVNDAPALAVANVGIAMGTGTDVAMESAGITLVKGDLRGIVQAIHLSRATMRNIRQNLLFAFLYNALGVPIAAGALYPFFGILLSPIIASAAMSFSSVSVVANALRLRKTPL